MHIQVSQSVYCTNYQTYSDNQVPYTIKAFINYFIAYWVIFHEFFRLTFFFKIIVFKKILSCIPSEYNMQHRSIQIWLEFIKLFSCSTQLSTKFQLLIKTKILKNEVSCWHFNIYEQDKFCAQLSFITSGPG